MTPTRPAAWIAFMLAADSYLFMYGSLEDMFAALHEGMDATERRDVVVYLSAVVAGDEATCRRATQPSDPIVAENTFVPHQQLTRVDDPCLYFHRAALEAFTPTEAGLAAHHQLQIAHRAAPAAPLPRLSSSATARARSAVGGGEEVEGGSIVPGCALVEEEFVGFPGERDAGARRRRRPPARLGRGGGVDIGQRAPRPSCRGRRGSRPARTGGRALRPAWTRISARCLCVAP